MEHTTRSAGRGGGLRIVDHRGRYIASLLSYEHWRESEEREADAALISASPDLLAACQYVVAEWVRDGQISVATAQACSEAVKKAKAGGSAR